MAKKEPFWVNPCNYPSEELERPSMTETHADQRNLGDVVRQVGNGLYDANEFKEKYVRSLQMDINSTKNHRYNWFPSNSELHKNLDEHTETEHLETLTVNKTVVMAYQYLQKFAAGLEIIQEDHAAANGKFQSNFSRMMEFLKLTLCELQEYMVSNNIKQLPNIRREDVPEEIRNIDSTTGQTVREWIVIRDYVNTLQYVSEALNHLYKS